MRPGMTLSAAWALAPWLSVHPRDEQAEQRALTGLAVWAGQFTPGVVLVPPQGLLLEVAGSLRLFGTPERLTEIVHQGVQALGYQVSIACAPTPRAACWLARSGSECRVTNLAALGEPLSAVPLYVLELDPEVLETLRWIGVHTVGDCLRLPRAGLARRCGAQLPDLLERALGRRPDPQTLFVPPAQFHAALELPAEVEETEALLFAAHRLLGELSGFLLARQGGIQQLTFALVHRDRSPTRLRLGLVAPTRELQHLSGLLHERLLHTALPAPVRAIGLRVARIQALAGRNLPLFGDDPHQSTSGQALLERLQARLGTAAVHGVLPVSEHRPERAWRHCVPGEQAAADGAAARPLWLLAQPRPLPLYQEQPCLEGPLRLLAGPERIESGWWDGEDVQRDYYVAQTPQGARCWIFRERGTPGAWYLHGFFA